MKQKLDLRKWLKRFRNSRNPNVFKGGPNLKRNLVVLSTAFLVEGQVQLKGLIGAIVALRSKYKQNKQATELITKCAEFAVYLARYAEQCSSEHAADPVERFTKAIKDLLASNSTKKSWLEAMEGYVDETIMSIESAHPSLSDLKKEPRPHGLPGTVVSILNVGFPVLDLLAEVLDMIGAVPFLHPILSAVTGLFHATQQTQSNFDNMLSLSTKAGEIALSIAEQCCTLQVLPADLAKAINELEIRLGTIASRCQEMSQKSIISSILQNNAFKDELEELERDLNTAIEEFQNTSLVNIQLELANIAKNVGRLRLDGLPKHPDMSGRLAEYLSESRKPNVENICKWIATSSELLLSIHGTAGVGKSTLALHLSVTLQAAGRLAGSLFLGTFLTDAFGPETIIKMLAHEIGSIHPRAISAIVEAMEQGPSTLNEQVQQYIIEPLKSLKCPFPLVIIVDAIDEWHAWPEFTKSLSCLNSKSSVVKFITTSRLNLCASPDNGIDNDSACSYLLLPVSTDVIKAYFDQYLKARSRADGRWKPSPADVNELAELSGGLPVWAAAVASLLSHELSISHPQEIVSAILTSRRPVGASGRLRELYSTALTRVLPSLEEREKESFRQYLGMTSILQEPVSQAEFASLTYIPIHLVTSIQSALSVLQMRSPPQGSEEMVHPAKTLFHPSLLEYVQAPTTGSEPFSISLSDFHSRLASTCLEQLDSLLGSHSPSLHQNYAVKNWPLHVSQGTPRLSEQWKNTRFCPMLEQMESKIQQWAALFLKTLVAKDSMMSTLKELACRLGQSGENWWSLQVACLEVAVRMDDSNSEVWSTLGRCYQARGDRAGRRDSLKMHEEAVIAFRGALRLQQSPSSGRAAALDELASALRSCYKQNRNVDILSEAIGRHCEALELLRASDPARAPFLSNCARSLHTFYERNGDIAALDEAISMYDEVKSLSSVQRPTKAVPPHFTTQPQLASPYISTTPVEWTSWKKLFHRSKLRS